MKKYTIVTLFLAVALVVSTPVVADAAWWNPFSWFRKVDIVNQNSASQNAQTKQEAKLEEKINKSIPASGAIELKLGEKYEASGAKVAVIKVIEDSRCPIDVACIQAGTVKIKVKGSYGLLSKTVTMTLGAPHAYKGYSATLVDVSPKPKSGVTINPSDYVFSFTIKTPTKTTENKTTGDYRVELAQCLKDKRAQFFGAYWCPHCQATKSSFGDGAKYLPYVECSTADGKDQIPICKDAKIEGYPTWKFKSGVVLTGEQPLETLAKESGCPFPDVRQDDNVSSVSLSDLRVQGELYYDSHKNTYAGFCQSSEALKTIKEVKAKTGNIPVCNSAVSSWAASVKNVELGYQCFDSKGAVFMSANQGLTGGQYSCI